MFRGATRVTLDAKGRLAIPARYRERLSAQYDGHLITTVDRDYCLLLYPLPVWEVIEAQIVKLPSLDRQARRLQRLMIGHATETDMDGHGRVRVPRELREFASLDKQVMLIGQGARFEIWDEQRWTEKRDRWLLEESEVATMSTELEALNL